MNQQARLFLRRLHGRAKAALKRLRELPVIYNVNSTDDAPGRKRALLIYLVESFLLKEDDPKFLRHQNVKRCKQIATVLGEFEYTVDAVDKRSSRRLRNRDYHLIIADRADLKGIDASFDAVTAKIFLATSMNYALHNKNVRRRHELLFERRKLNIEIRRPYPEAMPYLSQSNALVGLGNEFTMRTWKELFSGPMFPFNNYGFRETRFVFDGKDFAEARKHFLFFASRSQIQKGLDLLLEIFPKHPNKHLYVCSQFENEPDFCACYRKELFQTANIHPIGWITVNGPRYNELVDKCAYVIQPTCSEGQPGSVVQCMYSGLIPVVTKWAGIDTEDFGVTFSDDSLDEIERVVCEVTQLPENWHRERSIRTRKVTEAKYSEDAFLSRWREMLADIVNGPQTKRSGPLRSTV